MLTWKVGLIFGLFITLVAVIMWMLGLATSETSADSEIRSTLLAIPALAVAGGAMVSWNPQMSALAFAAAAVLVLFIFGTGILALFLCAVLAAGAIVALLDL